LRLVVSAGPAEHPEIVDGYAGRGRLEGFDDAILAAPFLWSCKGQAGEPEGLVVGQGSGWHGGLHRLLDVGEFARDCGLLRAMPEHALDATTGSATPTEEKAAVFADDAVDRPHPGHLIAPSAGAAVTGMTWMPPSCSLCRAR